MASYPTHIIALGVTLIGASALAFGLGGLLVYKGEVAKGPYRQILQLESLATAESKLRRVNGALIDCQVLANCTADVVESIDENLTNALNQLSKPDIIRNPDIGRMVNVLYGVKRELPIPQPYPGLQPTPNPISLQNNIVIVMDQIYDAQSNLIVSLGEQGYTLEDKARLHDDIEGQDNGIQNLNLGSYAFTGFAAYLYMLPFFRKTRKRRRHPKHT